MLLSANTRPPRQSEKRWPPTSGSAVSAGGFERFITEPEKLPKAVSEFDEALRGSLVEYVTVGKDKTMVFTLIGGTEMKA